MTGSDTQVGARGDWVRIHRTELPPEERSEDLPEDTHTVPLEMWVNGRLVTEEAAIGSAVTVETRAGRRVDGDLVEIDPRVRHDFGRLVPELADVGVELEKLMDETDR